MISAIENIDRLIEELEKQITSIELAQDIPAITKSKRLDRFQRDLERATKRREKLLDSQDQKETNDSASEDAAAEYAAFCEAAEAWLRDNDYYWVTTQNCWLKKRPDGLGWDDGVRTQALMIEYPKLRDRKFYEVFDDVLISQNRKFMRAEYSFRPVPFDSLNLISAEFCALVDDDQPHHPSFDILLYSLGGGKPENIEHIERLVQYKHYDPSEFLLPTLILQDPNGGSGKSLFAAVLMRTVVGQDIADNLSVSDVLGRFNMVAIGKAVVVINETVEEKVDDNALKRLLGSPIIYGEQKYMNKIPCANTGWYIIPSNAIAGAIRIAANDVDRRYSIIQATSRLEVHVANYYNLVDVPNGTTRIDQAADMIHQQFEPIFKDKIEVGRWLAHLYRKHGGKAMPRALHGEDYKKLCRLQARWYEEVCRAVFTSDFTYIKKNTLFNLYIDTNKTQNNGNGTLKRTTFYAHVDDWLKKWAPMVVTKQVQWEIHDGNDTRQSSAEIYVNAIETFQASSYRDNSDEYFEEDRFFHRRWKIEV